MKQLLAVMFALALAGCGSSGTTTVETASQTPARPGGQAGYASVKVTVLDGNTGQRLGGAQVSIGGRSARTGATGVARIPLRRHVARLTVVRLRGYTPRVVRLPFRERPRATVELFRPDLQWPMYGVGPSRTQAQNRIHLRPPFRVLWSHGVGSLTEFPAVVSDGVAYIANYRGVVEAISMTNGRLLWRHPTPNGKMAASPAVWGARVVAHGMDGNVWVLRRSDGRLLSHFTTGAPIESSPVVRRGIDYFGDWNGTVYALDLRRQQVRWTFRTGCKITSSASLTGGTLYIGDYCGRLHALRIGNGSELWAGSVNGRIYGTPAVAGGRVFVPSSSGGSLSAFSTRGSLLWRRSVGSYVYSSPAVWNGRVFFGSYGGVFYALEAASGRTLWEVPAGGSISGAAVVVAGVAYAGSFAHRIVGVDGLTGRVLLDFPHGEYVPVSGDGGRLLLHGYSRIYAVVPR